MGRELETLRVDIEADPRKLKQGAGEAKTSVKEMMASITQDIAKIKEAVVSISQSIEKLKFPARDIGAGKIVGQLDRVKTEARETAGQLDSMPAVDLTITRAGETAQTLDEFKSSLREMRGLIDEGYRGGILENLQTELEEVKERFPEATRVIREYEDAIKRAKEPTGTKTPPQDAAPSEDTVGRRAARDRIAAMVDGVKRYIREAQVAAGIRVYTEDYKRICADVDRAESSLERLTQKQRDMQASGVSTESKEWQKVAAQISAAERQLDIYRGKRNVMEYRGQDTQPSGSLADQSWGRSAEAVTSAAMSAVPGKVREITSAVSQAVGRIPVIGRVAKESAYIGSKAFSGMKAVLKTVTAAVKKTGGTFAWLIQKFRTGVSAVKKVGSAIGGLVGAFKKLIPGIGGAKKANDGLGGSFKGGLKNIMKYAFGIRSLYMLVNKFRNAVKEGFKNLAQYSDSTNASLSMLMSSLTQLKNALATAFAPLLDVVAPVLNAIIQKVISVADAFGQLTASLTGKGSYVRAKKVQQDYAASVADSASNAKKAEKANEEYKRSIMGFDQINKLDDDTSTGDNEDASDKPGLTPGDMFETVPVSSKIKGIADKIKEAWANADFTEIGSMVGNKLKSALEGIPWDGIKAQAARIGKSLATLINGFVEVPGLGYTIGNTIAQGINTGLTGLDAFAGNLHWDSVGAFIGDGINGALGNIDWKTALSAASNIGAGLADLLNHLLTPEVFSNIGNTISMGLNTAFTAVHDFAAGFNWRGTGEAVGTGLNTAMSTLDWNLIRGTAVKIGTGIADLLNGVIGKTDFGMAGTTLGQSINTLLDLGCSFVTTFDWGGLGLKTADGFNSALRAIDFAEAGTIVSESIKGLLDWFIRAVENTDWRLFGEKVKEFLVNIDWNGIFDKLSEAIGAAFGGFAAFLAGLFGDAIKSLSEWWNTTAFDENGNFTMDGFLKGIAESLKNIGTWIKEHIAIPFLDGFAKAFGLDADGRELFDMGADIVSGFLKGIKDGVLAIGQWIYDHVFTPFINGFKRAFGINSPSTVMAEQGGFIIEGLLKGLAGAIGSVLGWVARIPGWIKEKLGNAKDWLKEKGKDAIEGLKTGWESVKESKIGKAASGLGSFIKQKAGDATGWIKSKGSDAIEGLKTGWESVKSGALLSRVGTIGSEVHTKIGDMKAKTKDRGQDIINGMVNGYTGRIGHLLKQVETLRGSIHASLGDISGKVRPKGREIAAGLKEGLEAGWPTVTGWLNGIPGRVASAIGSLRDTGRSAMESLADGMKSVHIPTPSMYISSWDSQYVGDGGTISIPRFSVQWYATGGFPQAGEMFIANEAGPEMVGRMGNRNVVANNSQIVEGIKAGVFEAVMDAFQASGLSGGDGQQKDVTLEFTLIADNETLYKAVLKGRDSYDGRFHAVCRV